MFIDSTKYNVDLRYHPKRVHKKSSMFSFGKPGWSAGFFMEQNKQLVLNMIDHSHPGNNKYHKIHKWLIENSIGEAPDTRRRTKYIAKFMRRNGQ